MPEETETAKALRTFFRDLDKGKSSAGWDLVRGFSFETMTEEELVAHALLVMKYQVWDSESSAREKRALQEKIAQLASDGSKDPDPPPSPR